ncbi:DUF6879 family protein [Nocardioides speluncae]|uniref:DUF6879 family protein n=1 Tax=Nocardioides speluncae TaxID=2670337 RepID=UPI000D68BCB2|nr:DUF6879 family protein [Nocardioides speluncae]
MSEDRFDSYFDKFSSDVFRLETLQAYAVAEEDERLAAFRTGAPRPLRSVRNTPWLARIAVTTAQGKRWQRAHVVEHPLSVYVRYELVGYVESQAAGETIGLAVRDDDAALADLAGDFWLFDGDQPAAFALLMHYDSVGTFQGFEHTTEPAVLDRCRAHRSLALRHAMTLNAYLAGGGL